MAQLQSTDLLLINRGDVTYTMTFGEIEASVNDKLMNGLTLSGDPFPTFQDTDLFLVNRDDTTYTISFADLKDSINLGVPPVLTNVSLIEHNPGVLPRFTDQQFTATATLSVDGVPQSEKTFDAYVEGSLKYARTSTNTITAVATESSNWQKATLEENVLHAPGDTIKYYPRSAAFGNNKFVIVGNSSLIQHSNDGIDFTAVDANTWHLSANSGDPLEVSGSNITDITFGDGVFIAIGNYDYAPQKPLIVRSTNGIDWTQLDASALPTNAIYLTGIAYGNGKFIASSIQTSTPLLESTDGGLTWQAIPGTENLATVTSGIQYLIWSDVDGTNGSDGLWIGSSIHGFFKSYNNGATWTEHTSPSTYVGGNPLTYANGIFYLLANEGSTFYYSTDYTSTWKSSSIPNYKPVNYQITNVNGVIYTGYGNSGYGNDVLTATNDATVWVEPPEAKVALGNLAQYYYGGVYGKGVYLAVFSREVIYATIPVESRRLTITGCLTDGFESGELVHSDPAGGGQSVVIEVTDDYMLVTDQGVWAEGQYVVGRYLTQDNARNYLKFDSSGNVTDLLNKPQSPPYVTTDLNPQLTLTFPSTFPSGLPPDEELGEGTTLTVSVVAENDSGTSGPLSDTVQPGVDTIQFNEPLESTGTETGGWTTAPAAENSGWFCVTYGGDKFVAVSNKGTSRVMYSTNGIDWISASAAEVNEWYSVTYGDGKYVAVSRDGTSRVMYSTDAINWTAASAAEANSWQSVAYGDGKFVAVANDGTNRVMWSTDAINWTAVRVQDANNWRSVTYGDGKFVAVSDSGTYRVMYSLNGIDWNRATAALQNTWLFVTYGGDKFVAIGGGSGVERVMYSTDAINWTAASAAEANNWRSVAYGDGKFVAVGSSGTNRVMWSTNGIDWTSASSPPEANPWYSITYGAGKFVAVANGGTNQVMWSYSGTNEDLDTLIFADGTDMSTLAAGDAVNQDSASGTVGSITDTTVTLSRSTNDWVTAANGGANVIGPNKTPIRSLTEEELEAQKLQFLTYDNRREVNCGQQAQAKRDALRTSLLAAGYTEPEIAAAYVNPDDTVTPAEPIAISGYYPLYESEADANAAGDGTSHTHLFNSVTYYMPNGVTFYHGDYGSSY